MRVVLVQSPQLRFFCGIVRLSLFCSNLMVLVTVLLLGGCLLHLSSPQDHVVRRFKIKELQIM